MTTLTALPPSQRCRATARRTGERCRLQAIRGATVCGAHGGRAPQVRRAAEARVTLQTILRDGDPRHPWEVMLDALHTADALMRDATVRVREGDELTPADLDRMVEAIERAARLAKATIDARAHEHIAAREKLEVEVEARALVRILEAGLRVLDLDDRQWFDARKAMSDEMLKLDADQVPGPRRLTGRNVITVPMNPQVDAPMNGQDY